MKKKILLAGLFLLAIKLLFWAQPTVAEPFYLGGIQVNEPNTEQWIQALKAADMNTVQVTVYAHQGDWDTDNIWFDAKNDGVVEEIRQAKAAGLHVVLILRVALDHAFEKNRFLWHGLIMPRTDEQLASWFQKYTQFVTTWATIAEQEGVDILGIASEMNALTSTQPVQAVPDLESYYLDDDQQQNQIQELLSNQDQLSTKDFGTRDHHSFQSFEDFLRSRLNAWQAWARQASWSESPDPIARINQRRHLLEYHWRQLIRQTRTIYQGQLTYAANFDQYQALTFWDALDLIGVNAYFPLRPAVQTGLNEQRLASTLEAGWLKVLDQLDVFRKENFLLDRPVLFTELGYTRWENSTVAPWSYGGFSVVESQGQEQQDVILWNDQSTTDQERTLAIQALYSTLRNHHPSLLKGLLYWKLSTQPNHLAIEPYVLILNDSPQDPLQRALAKFRE